jgi:uncharacterized protein YndB with AHSA1/START domain
MSSACRDIARSCVRAGQGFVRVRLRDIYARHRVVVDAERTVPVYAALSRHACLRALSGRTLHRDSPDGAVFEIGRIRVWAPGKRLVFGWRQATFRPGQETEVEVTFEAIGAETLVTVVHRGWDSIPDEHLARHGFPDAIFLRRHGEWWQVLLARLREYGSHITKSGQRSGI